MQNKSFMFNNSFFSPCWFLKTNSQNFPPPFSFVSECDNDGTVFFPPLFLFLFSFSIWTLQNVEISMGTWKMKHELFASVTFQSWIRNTLLPKTRPPPPTSWSLSYYAQQPEGKGEKKLEILGEKILFCRVGKGTNHFWGQNFHFPTVSIHWRVFLHVVGLVNSYTCLCSFAGMGF